jgi:hypothetical protein
MPCLNQSFTIGISQAYSIVASRRLRGNEAAEDSSPPSGKGLLCQLLVKELRYDRPHFILFKR